MRKTIYYQESKKCLYCNTYHQVNKEYCPGCGRHLYKCGDIYLEKVRRSHE